ncbi:hypothetical protein BT93_G2385 [Corymbia citriodora subsp. variegata]|nr:hypothetical protein BT93_G2385 [Corymbia citriodora subsp. variegata]
MLTILQLPLERNSPLNQLPWCLSLCWVHL